MKKVWGGSGEEGQMKGLNWIDEWVEGASLTIKFPRLFLISEQREEVIGKMGFWREDKWCWNLRWRRSPFEWESELIIQLNIFLSSV